MTNFKSETCSPGLAIAFLATGFLLMFLFWPISRKTLYLDRVSSSPSPMKPGAGSTRIIAGGPSRGRNWRATRRKASRKVSLFSSVMKQATEYEDTHSLSTKMSWQFPLRTTAANVKPMASLGSSEDWGISWSGNFFKEAHVWHDSQTLSMAFPRSRA